MKRYEITSQAAQDPSCLPSGARHEGGLTLAIGFFDGVHRGHAQVIRQAVAAARERGETPAVMTFDPHPRAVLGHGDQYCTVLTPLEDKLTLMAELGMEVAYVIRFDQAFAGVTAQQFARELLVSLGVRTVVVGFDFTFGKGGEGNAQSLRVDGEGCYEVIVADPVEGDGDKVSSTRVRDELAAGHCEQVIRLLDRPYRMAGRVVHGQARGRLLGFPTANIEIDQPYVIPKVGVYAIRAHIVEGPDTPPERVYDGVLNVGYRPTFEQPEQELKLEAHLFDFQGDLYGKTLAIHFYAFIREERKFSSMDALVAQIRQDAAQARRQLAAESHL